MIIYYCRSLLTQKLFHTYHMQFPLWKTSQTLKWEAVWRELGSLGQTASFAIREESGHSLKSSLSVFVFFLLHQKVMVCGQKLLFGSPPKKEKRIGWKMVSKGFKPASLISSNEEIFTGLLRCCCPVGDNDISEKKQIEYC